MNALAFLVAGMAAEIAAADPADVDRELRYLQSVENDFDRGLISWENFQRVAVRVRERLATEQRVLPEWVSERMTSLENGVPEWVSSQLSYRERTAEPARPSVRAWFRSLRNAWGV